MNFQLYRLVMGFRKQGIRPGAKRVIAETISMVARENNGKEQQEAVLEQVIDKNLFESLVSKFHFDISKTPDADLVQEEEKYSDIDHILWVCIHVATANPEVMADLTGSFQWEHWGAWLFIQDLDVKTFEVMCELYAPFGKGQSMNTSTQLVHIKEINPIPSPTNKVQEEAHA